MFFHKLLNVVIKCLHRGVTLDSQIKSILDELFATNLPNDVLMTSNYRAIENMGIDSETDMVIPPKFKLRKLFGKNGEPFSEHIGTHPDFMGEDLPRKQYICSLFLDISGSTKLGLKFPLETVRLYKNAILSSAIKIFQVFDGHIHRLQGDAVFAYFGHKKMSKSDAIINALNAATLMQSYNKYTLSEFFKSNDLPPLKIKVGIDIGDDEQVLWSSFGIDGVQEITTTSLHTDLASKLQNKARENSILLGENIYKFLDLPDEFLRIKTFMKNNVEKEDRYIVHNSDLGVYYQMRELDWERYIQSFSFLPKQEGNLKYHAPEDFEVVCRYSESGESELREYKSNTKTLEKGFQLQFQLQLKKILNIKRPYKVTWEVQNRGQEATNAGNLQFYMVDHENNYTCYQETAYNGHHYMVCRLYNTQNRLIGKEKFGIFVNDGNVKLGKIGNAVEE